MAVGRPRSFDPEKALEKAMQVFWRKGFEGASLPDLTKAMGINRPSLYSAFGNKQALFQKVLARYGEGPAAFAALALREPTARGVAEKLLFGSAESLACPKHRGCLLVQGALCGGEEAVRKDLAAKRKAGEAELRKRFEKARAEGDLPRKVDAGDLARFVTTTLYGMSVQATGGATAEELRRVAETAMRAWPG
jgi:AcrR family transcriptional regulator